MIAGLLNVGGGIRLIKQAKLDMCTHTHYKHNEDRRTAAGVRGHGSIPLSHSGNAVKRIGLHTHTLLCKTFLESSGWMDDLQFYVLFNSIFSHIRMMSK